MLRISILALCILPFDSLCAICASFDCAKARTFAEKEICSSKELSSLDDRLEASYRKALLNAPDENSLKDNQRSWLRNTRDACRNSSCLKSAYGERLREINKTATDKASGPQGANSKNGITGRYSITKTDIGGNVDVRQIAHNKIRFKILTVVGPTAHTCVVEGAAVLNNASTAVFREKPDDSDETCTISLSFTERQVKVLTENCSSYCGVRAFMNGLYTRVSDTPDFK